MSLIKGRNGDWEIVIELEVHAQVSTASKLFSGASIEFGAELTLRSRSLMLHYLVCCPF